MRDQDQDTGWADLVIDRRVSPEPLDDTDFRAWMRGQRVFVSSTMDGELTPYREGVRKVIESSGGEAVMWETLAPREENPTGAYLGGVRRSTAFVFVAGQRYGAQDASGYSPTEAEVREAERLHIPRLLIELNCPDRAGLMRDLIRSLYPVLSGDKVETVEGAAAAVERALRRMAAESHYIWIKLGRYVFIGRVEQKTSRQGRRFTVRAEVAAEDVRRGLMELAGGHSAEVRLTWPDESYRVKVEAVRSVSESHGSRVVELECVGSEEQGLGWSINFDGMGRLEQSQQWLKKAWLGEAAVAGNQVQGRGAAGMLTGWLEPKGPTLPEVLKSADAGLWQTTGLARLYLVESLSRKWDGFFSELSVGPATDRSVPVAGTVVLPAEASNLQPESFLVREVVERR